MAVAFVQGKTNSSASTTSATVTLSGAPTSGNLLVAVLSHATSTRPNTVTPSGSGWTLAGATSGAGGTSRSAAMWWKVAGAGESATITWTGFALTAPWAMTIVEYSGVDTTTSLIAGTFNLQGASTAYATASVTPTAGSGVAVILAHNRTTASSTAYSAHQWAASATGVTARVNNNLNNQAGASGYGTAWDFIGSLVASAATGTVTAPVSEVGVTAVIGFAAAAAGGGSPVFVPGMGVRRRSIRRAIPATPNPADIPTPTDAPVPKVYVRREPRRWPMPRINPGTWVPPSTVVTPPVNPLITGLTAGRIRRVSLFRGRRSGVQVPANDKIGTVRDPFDALLPVWAFAGGATVTGGHVLIVPTPSYDSLYTRNRYTLRNSAASVELVQPPNIGTGTVEVYFSGMSVFDPGGSGFMFFLAGGFTVYGVEKVNGVNDLGTGIPFDPAAMLFWRIRHDGTNVIWEYSPDGLGWITLRSKIPATDIDNLQFLLQSGYYGVEPSPGVTIFDNFNIVTTLWRGFFSPRRARLPLGRARARSITPLPAQVIVTGAPAITQTTTARIRRAVTSYRRHAAPGGPVAPQDELPGPTTRRRLPIMSARRRASASSAAFQDPLPRAAGRRRAAAVRPRTKVVAPVPPQFNPPIVQTVFGRLRTVGRVKPRTKVVSPTQAQQSLTPNPAITATVFGRLRTIGRIQPRGKVSTTVPPQFNPPIVQTVFGRLRTVGRVRPRTKVASPTQAQQPLTPNPAITATVFGRLRAIGRIRPRTKVVAPVPPQFNPPIVQTVFGRLRTVGRVRPRTKVARPTQAQQSLTPNPVITATVFGRLRAAGRVRPRTKAVTPVPPQFNPPIVQTVFGRLRTVGRIKPRTRAVTPVVGQTAITATVFGRLRTVGRVRPRTKAVTPVPLQENAPNPVFGRLRSKGRTNRIPRASKPISPQANPLYPIRPSVGGLSGLRRVWLKIRRKNAYPVPAQIVTLQGPLIITDSHGGVEADRASGTVISGTYGSSSSSTVSSGSSGGFTADPDADNVAPTYDSDSDSL